MPSHPSPTACKASGWTLRAGCMLLTPPSLTFCQHPSDLRVTSHSTDTFPDPRCTQFHCVDAERQQSLKTVLMNCLICVIMALICVFRLKQWWLVTVYFGKSLCLPRQFECLFNVVLTFLCALASQILTSVLMKPSVGTTASARTQTAPSAATVTKATPTHQEIWANVLVCNCSPINIQSTVLLKT